MLSRVTCVLLVPATILACLSPSTVLARVEAPAEQGSELEATSEVEQGNAPASETGESEGEAQAELAPVDPAVAQAQLLFEQGLDSFETADYIGAIELWTRAYGIVQEQGLDGLIMAKLIANLASAHERAYKIDASVSHLHQAKILLEDYHAAIEEIYASPAERDKEFAWVAERMERIDAELEIVAEREAEAARQANPPPDPERTPTPGRGLMIGGSVLTVLGVGGLGVMVGGMVLGSQNNDISDLPTNEFEVRADRYASGRLGNTLAIAGGVGGAVLLGGGIAMLAVGLKLRAAGPAPATAALRFAPTFGAHDVGVRVQGRF